MDRFFAIRIISLANLVVFVIIVLSILATSRMSDTAALAEEAPTQTPEAEVIQMNAEETPEPDKMPRPIPTICCYDWTVAEVEAMARGFYGLDTSDEKFGFCGVVVNRFFSKALRLDGKLLFGDGTFIGVIEQQDEFRFYDKEAPATKENMELAEYFMNVHTTARLTNAYTGYAFPGTALYFGWYDGVPVVYTELHGEPIFYKGR